jgi:hypothetical protein
MSEFRINGIHNQMNNGTFDTDSESHDLDTLTDSQLNSFAVSLDNYNTFNQSMRDYAAPIAAATTALDAAASARHVGANPTGVAIAVGLSSAKGINDYMGTVNDLDDEMEAVESLSQSIQSELEGRDPIAFQPPAFFGLAACIAGSSWPFWAYSVEKLGVRAIECISSKHCPAGSPS